MKLLVAFVACCLGVLSHFYPVPFPQNKPLLIGCVLGYVLCAAAYYLIERNMEGDAFYIAGKHNINAIKEFQKVHFASEIDCHGEEQNNKMQDAMYTLRIRSVGGSTNKKIECERKVSVT